MLTTVCVCENVWFCFSSPSPLTRCEHAHISYVKKKRRKKGVALGALYILSFIHSCFLVQVRELGRQNFSNVLWFGYNDTYGGGGGRVDVTTILPSENWTWNCFLLQHTCRLGLVHNYTHIGPQPQNTFNRMNTQGS